MRTTIEDAAALRRRILADIATEAISAGRVASVIVEHDGALRMDFESGAFLVVTVDGTLAWQSAPDEPIDTSWHSQDIAGAEDGVGGVFSDAEPGL